MVERQDAQEDSEAGPGSATQAYKEETLISKPSPINRNAGPIIRRFQEDMQNEVQENEDDPNDLDKKVPWPVPFPDNEVHWEVWQMGIQTAKNMFKVDGAEYTFSTWFAKVPGKELTNILLSAKSEKEVAKKAKEVYLQRDCAMKK